MPEPPICCLCGQPCEPWYPWSTGYGHNPEPLAAWPERCCNDCNANRVIPARLRQIHPSSSNNNQNRTN